tara:strand:- start:105 stop:347 length:243 start_codon:yes stop_codon:yes gene_type:complete
MRASIRELRSETKAIMNAVGHGESVVITYYGEDFAEIKPIKKKKSSKASKSDEAFGMWADHKDIESVDAYVDKLRQGRQL